MVNNLASQPTTPVLPEASPSPKELLRFCVSFSSSFNPARLTLDSHAENCVAELKITNPDAKSFVTQVLYGVYRYRRLLKALSDAFFQECRWRSNGCRQCKKSFHCLCAEILFYCSFFLRSVMNRTVNILQQHSTCLSK